MGRLGKMAGVLGSAALAGIPASAGAGPLPETEPNNTFPGQPATAEFTYSGGVSDPADPIDFFHYTGLPPGGSFDLSFDPISVRGGDDLKAGLYSDQTTILDSVTSTGPLVHLTGVIPGTGELTFGITPDVVLVDTFEGYLVTLDVTPLQVPAPPAIALLAAGLTALSLDVARRRKRREEHAPAVTSA